MTCQKSFCVACALLLPRFPNMRCIFRGKRSTLDTSDVIPRGRRSTLDVWRCDFCANRIVRAASTGENVQIPWKVLHFWTSDENASVMSGLSPKSVSQECLPKSVSQECLPGVSSQEGLSKSVMPRVSPKSVMSGVSSKGCLPKRVPQECHVRSV